MLRFRFLTVSLFSAAIVLRATNATPTLSWNPLVSVAGGTSGYTQNISYVAGDPDGLSDLAVSNVLINYALDGRAACYVAVDHANRVLYLVNDAGNAISTGMTFDSTGRGIGAVGNSQCTVIGANTYLGLGADGGAITINLSFSIPFAGNKVVYLAAGDKGGLNTGWTPAGVRTVPSTTTTYPRVLGGWFSTVVGGPFNYRFAAVFQDASNSGNLSPSQILVSSALDGRHACYFGYDHSNNRLYLVDDTGSRLLDSIAPGYGVFGTGTNVVENSQCGITGASGYVHPLLVDGAPIYAVDPTAYVLEIAVTVKPGFSGPKILYAATQTLSGGNSGWQAAATAILP